MADRVITLNADQEDVVSKFLAFLVNPNEWHFVIRGYSGTGKSTMISVLLQRLNNLISASGLLNENIKKLDVLLTATTNKAADTFAQIAGRSAGTIHSALELTLQTDIASGETFLTPRRNASLLYDKILFIDEASYIDANLLKLILSRTQNCKIIFIGDPDQLLTPRSTKAVAFHANFPEGKLEKPMRQLINGLPQASPITDLAHGFRGVIHGRPWPKFDLSTNYVKWMPEEEFEKEILKEFSRSDWISNDSKVLTFTNRAAIYYNGLVREHLHGDPMIQVGDYVENNHFISSGGKAIKTDATVLVTDIEETSEVLGVYGNWLTVDYSSRYFMPKDRKAKQARLNQARLNQEWNAIREVETWIDLRAIFGQTTNKAQGSTYRMVFINLNDLKSCTSNDQLARMLYVGTSRASHQVIFTGDLV